MAVGLRNSVQISAYIAPHLKAEIDRIAKENRRESISFQVETALMRYVEEKKRQEQPSFSKPTQKPHGKRRRAA